MVSSAKLRAAQALVKSAEGQGLIYDEVELSAIVEAHRQGMITMAKDLRDALTRIGELEDQATRP